MHLLTTWRESLEIFRPKNLKLFLLVTLNALVQGGKVWITYFWWLLIICYFYGPHCPLDFLYPMTFLLALRPSVSRKTGYYFLSYLPRATMLLIMFIAFVVIFMLLSEIVNCCMPIKSVALKSVALSIIAGVHHILFLLYFLFGIDGAGYLSALVKAVRMFLYNFPLFIPVMIVGMIMDVYARPVAYGIIVSAWLIVEYAFVTNIYIKKVYDQFSLYFPTKG